MQMNNNNLGKICFFRFLLLAMLLLSVFAPMSVPLFSIPLHKFQKFYTMSDNLQLLLPEVRTQTEIFSQPLLLMARICHRPGQTELPDTLLQSHPAVPASAALYRPLSPVSYTHLDVYKRQILNRALTSEIAGHS